MENKFTLEYADGYYIELNGVGVIDFTEDKKHDYEFCWAICEALNIAYITNEELIERGRKRLNGLHNS